MARTFTDPILPVFDEPEDWTALEAPTVQRREASVRELAELEQLAADVILVRDALLVRAGEVLDLDVASERARQIVGILAMSERLAK
jgi:hypothetical protein